MSPSLRFLLLSFVILILSVPAHSGHNDAENSGRDTHNLRSGPLLITKIWCLIIIFSITFVAGVSPYLMKWNEGFLVLGTQFAGGVFLGTAMMHFLCDANKTFEDLSDKEYPFAYMLACFGYLITMLADSVVSSIFLQQSGGSSLGAGVELEGFETDKAIDNSAASKSQHHVHAALVSASSFGDTVLLIMALCFHSLFEGIAIGVAETKANAWRALWTISLHKIFAAIAMGIALLRMIPNRPLLSCAAYSFLFAISSPVGVAIGIIIDATTQGAVADWIFAISIGLACGVFIYVTINHLLSKGYEAQKPVKVDKASYKFLSVLLGTGVIAVAMIWD